MLIRRGLIKQSSFMDVVQTASNYKTLGNTLRGHAPYFKARFAQGVSKVPGGPQLVDKFTPSVAKAVKGVNRVKRVADKIDRSVKKAVPAYGKVTNAYKRVSDQMRLHGSDYSIFNG